MPKVNPHAPLLEKLGLGRLLAALRPVMEPRNHEIVPGDSIDYVEITVTKSDLDALRAALCSIDPDGGW